MDVTYSLQSKNGMNYVEIMPFLLSVHFHGRGREQSFGFGSVDCTASYKNYLTFKQFLFSGINLS
jgi:hypothetical protein